jgi:hypothetical protein
MFYNIVEAIFDISLRLVCSTKVLKSIFFDTVVKFMALNIMDYENHVLIISSITVAVAELTKSLVLKPKIDLVIHHTTKFVKYLRTRTTLAGPNSIPPP